MLENEARLYFHLITNGLKSVQDNGICFCCKDLLSNTKITVHINVILRQKSSCDNASIL